MAFRLGQVCVASLSLSVCPAIAFTPGATDVFCKQVNIPALRVESVQHTSACHVGF